MQGNCKLHTSPAWPNNGFKTGKFHYKNTTNKASNLITENCNSFQKQVGWLTYWICSIVCVNPFKVCWAESKNGMTGSCVWETFLKYPTFSEWPMFALICYLSTIFIILLVNNHNPRCKVVRRKSLRNLYKLCHAKMPIS